MVEMEMRDVSEALEGVFWDLGMAYMPEVDSGHSRQEHEGFLRSVLDRRNEPERWLRLFGVGGDYVGFSYMKIDRDERPGWGYILEFYVAPAHRRCGIASAAYAESSRLLREHGVSDVWLAAHRLAEGFWLRMGFAYSGEMEGDQRVMVARIA